MVGVTNDTLLADLMPAVRALSRTDRLHLIQVLAADLAGEEEEPSIEAGASFPVWTPLEATEAASVLLREIGSLPTLD